MSRSSRPWLTSSHGIVFTRPAPDSATRRSISDLVEVLGHDRLPMRLLERHAQAGQGRRPHSRVSRASGSFERANITVAASHVRRREQALFLHEPRTQQGTGTDREGPSESELERLPSLARLDKEQESLRDAAELRRFVRRTGRPNPDAARHTREQPHALLREPQDGVRRARRPASSVRISSRVVVHGTGDTRPSRTSADRRRSSSAQAATTSSSISSRLDSSSAATRARSSRDNRSASASRSSVDIIVSLALWVSRIRLASPGWPAACYSRFD